MVLVVISITCSIFALQPRDILQQQSESTIIDLGNGQTLEVGPDEILEQYVIGETPNELTGTGDPLNGTEYGLRTDTFSNKRMNYDSTSQSTSTVNLTVPLGEDWEGYEVFGNITSITENRTWIENSGFDDNSVWTYTYINEPRTYPAAEDNVFISQWLSDGHGTGDGSSYFGIDGYYYDAGGGLYGDWYDPGDRAYAVQM